MLNDLGQFLGQDLGDCQVSALEFMGTDIEATISASWAICAVPVLPPSLSLTQDFLASPGFLILSQFLTLP